MATQDTPTFILGDVIVYRLVFTCKANIKHVEAIFINADTEGVVTLEGKATFSDVGHIPGTRLQQAVLTYDLSTHID